MCAGTGLDNNVCKEVHDYEGAHVCRRNRLLAKLGSVAAKPPRGDGIFVVDSPDSCAFFQVYGGWIDRHVSYIYIMAIY